MSNYLKDIYTKGRINFLFSLLSTNKSFIMKLDSNINISSKTGLVVARSREIYLYRLDGFLTSNLFKIKDSNDTGLSRYIDIKELRNIPKRREDIYQVVLTILFLMDRINKLIRIYNKNNKIYSTFYYHSWFDILCFSSNDKIYALNDFNNIADLKRLDKDLDKKSKQKLQSVEAKEIVDLDAKIQNLIDETIAPYLLLKDL